MGTDAVTNSANEPTLAWALKGLKEAGFYDAAQALERLKQEERQADAARAGAPHAVKGATDGTIELSTCVLDLRFLQCPFGVRARACAGL